MMNRLAFPAALFFAGCAYRGSATDFDPTELQRSGGWRTATEVPVILQKDREDCGAAALAMALAAWQVTSCRDEVAEACPSTPGQGIKSGTLRDFARRKGLQAFVLQGEFADLEHEISKGRPVIAGLVKPYATRGLTHYEIVVALHPERRLIATIDPARGWRQNSFEGFRSEWEPAGRLLLVVFRAPADSALR